MSKFRIIIHVICFMVLWPIHVVGSVVEDFAVGSGSATEGSVGELLYDIAIVFIYLIPAWILGAIIFSIVKGGVKGEEGFWMLVRVSVVIPFFIALVEGF